MLASLEDLAGAAERIAQIGTLIRANLPQIRDGRERGLSYREILAGAPRPLIGAVLTEAITRFEGAGTRYRRAHARALQGDGMTLQEIAELWGLTRQRISELLQTQDGQPDDRRPGRSPDGASGSAEPARPSAGSGRLDP